MDNDRTKLTARLQKEAELARQRSQRLVEIAKRSQNAQDQNDLIVMALAEGHAAEAFDHAVYFLHEAKA